MVFISSVLIFRNINRDEYGLYVLILSLFAISELFMGGYNQAITRFLKENISILDKRQIILYSIYYKCMILIVFFGVIYLFYYLNFIEYFINDYDKVEYILNKYILIAILNNLLSVLSGISFAILTALYHYKITNNSMVIKNFIYLLCVFYLIFITDEYIIFLYVNLSLNFFIYIYLSIFLATKYPEYSFQRLCKCKLDLSIYKRHLFSYATPLTTISVLTYIKNHIPILILGKEFELEDVAIFSIVKKFFKTLHTISASFFQPLLSRFITIKNENISDYILIMNKVYYITFFSRCVIYIILLFLSSYFFLILKIEQSYIYSIIFAILGFEFVIAGMMTVYGTILSTNKTTKYLLYTSIIRFIIELMLIYYILLIYGIVGAAIILLLSRFIETISGYYFVGRENIIKYDYMIILGLIPLIIYFCTNLY